MNQRDVEGFANLLEKHGYKGAMRLIMEELIPMAREKKISLLDSAEVYSTMDCGNKSHRLRIILPELKERDTRVLDIHKPFKRM